MTAALEPCACPGCGYREPPRGRGEIHDYSKFKDARRKSRLKQRASTLLDYLKTEQRLRGVRGGANHEPWILHLTYAQIALELTTFRGDDLTWSVRSVARAAAKLKRDGDLLVYLNGQHRGKARLRVPPRAARPRILALNAERARQRADRTLAGGAQAAVAGRHLPQERDSGRPLAIVPAAREPRSDEPREPLNRLPHLAVPVILHGPRRGGLHDSPLRDETNAVPAAPAVGSPEAAAAPAAENGREGGGAEPSRQAGAGPPSVRGRLGEFAGALARRRTGSPLSRAERELLADRAPPDLPNCSNPQSPTNRRDPEP